MLQRQSLALDAVYMDSPHTDNVAVAACLTRYFLEGQNTAVEIIFLDKSEIMQAVRDGVAYGSKLLTGDIEKVMFNVGGTDSLTRIHVKGVSDINVVMAELILLAQNRPVACIIQFENGHVLSIAGSWEKFYIFDIRNHLFTTSESPEFDVLEYHAQFGASGPFQVSFWTIKEQPKPAINLILESESEKNQDAEEPKTKKPRIVRKIKKKDKKQKTEEESEA